MSILTIKLLGTPMVLKDKIEVYFPFRKAEAIFYYVVINNRVSRETLINLFWGDVSEETARKNLRNAVYIIKKVFNEEIIISPQRNTLILNPKSIVNIDVIQLLENNNINLLEQYRGNFLEGFSIKDAKYFEEWMLAERDKYRNIYIQRLWKEISQNIKDKRFLEVEQYCKALNGIDGFDERAYRILMKIYKMNGKYNSGIEIYNQLVELLKKELSISPDRKTTALFNELVLEKSKNNSLNKKAVKELFYGRDLELGLLQTNYNKFLRGEKAKAYILLGEVGIGKSKLLDYFIKNNINKDTLLLKTNCYQAEEGYLLKPWYYIFYQLAIFINNNKVKIPDVLKNIVGYIFPSIAMDNTIETEKLLEQVDYFKYQVAEKAIIEILKLVSKNHKIVIIFEDIQWIDETSLALIRNIILGNKNRTLLMMATCRNDYKFKLDSFITEVGGSGLMERLELRRFNYKEVVDFSLKKLPYYNFTETLKKYIFQETEGNPLFLDEFINNLDESQKGIKLTSKMQDILRSRLINISIEAKKIVYIASIYFDKISLNDLFKLCGKQEMELLDILDELQERNILKEVEENNKVYFVFTHGKLREYAYSQLTISRKRLLHKLAASLLEEEINNTSKDILLYSKLIYHYSNSGNQLSALTYKIKYIEEHFHYKHEMFPVIHSENNIVKDYLYFNQEKVLTELDEISGIINQLKEELGTENLEIKKIEVLFFHILGRFYIRQGDYQNGISISEQLITNSLEIRNYSYALKGYRQKIYYCINTQQTEMMKEYIEKALLIAEEYNDQEEVGILLRLKGLLNIMEASFLEGESNLRKSIYILENSIKGENYILNIAAAFNYIGESKRKAKQFEESYDYYRQAVAICEERNLFLGIAIFYTNWGQATFDNGDKSKAKELFEKAIIIFEQLDSLWGRSIAEGYLSLLLIKEKKYQESLAYFNLAEKHSQKLKSPYEMALFSRVKAEIKIEMNTDIILHKFFRNILTEQANVYCDFAISLLNKMNGCYEMELLENIKEKGV